MTIAAKLGAPILLTALIVGFAISLFQSVTQIQESTLSFVPKAVAIGDRAAASPATGCCTRWSATPSSCTPRSPT